jgi:menaquinone-dependent protoporphyrinogen oxidase
MREGEMPKVLVVYASRMGSTGEIARAIGAQLVCRGLTVDVRDIATAEDARHYDAVIVGSALYTRRWDSAAVRYLQRQAADLAERPTWLFQSGPCGPDQDTTVPRAIIRLVDKIGLEAPTTFGGNLDASRATSWLSRAVASGDLAGDFRDWDQIRAWADARAEQILHPDRVMI